MANGNLFTIRIPPELATAIDAAVAQGKSRTEIGVAALSAYLKLKGVKSRPPGGQAKRNRPATVHES